MKINKQLILEQMDAEVLSLAKTNQVISPEQLHLNALQKLRKDTAGQSRAAHTPNLFGITNKQRENEELRKFSMRSQGL